MADDKKTKPVPDPKEIDRAADADTEGASSKQATRDRQDSLFEDEGWEDADDGNGEDEDDDESDDETANEQESDDEAVDDEDEEEEEDDDEEDGDEEEEGDDDEDGDDEDGDEDEEDDDEDEEDDDEDEEDWLPDWAPWAVLAGLVLLGLAGGFGFLTPNSGEQKPSAAEVSVAPPSEPTAAAPTPPPTAAAPTQGESISASHLLVAYQGALRASPQITRSKDEAKKRALEAMKKAKQPGADFAKLVAEYSDEPGAARREGKLGSFTRERMVKPFSDAAFQLKVGEISDVVETAFGFHVIQRTQ